MSKGWHAAALAAYLGVALWVMRAVLPMPADSYPMPARQTVPQIGDQDQSHMIWTTARTARTLVTAPWRLWDFESCYPFPRAVALGHHLYANALVGVVPYALTREPILTQNIVALLMLWLSAAGMYALAFYWTRSVPAALVAGAAFAFVPMRLFTLRWPAIVGNQWTPLALLFAHRLVERNRWRDAAALAAFIGMQLLESFYQMIPIAVYGAVYAPVLLARRAGQWRALLPKLALVAAVTVTVALVVLVPYVQARQVWGLVGGHLSLLPLLNRFEPGNPWYPGTTLLLLATAGLIDRARRRRGEDPRLPLVVGCLLLLALAVRGVRIPGVGIVPALGALLGRVPGLDIVRGIQFALVGVSLAPALLAAYGVLMLLERRRPAVALLVGVGLAALVAAEPLVPTLSTVTFGADTTVGAAPFTVPRHLAGLLRERLPDGAVLDVPVADAPLAYPRRGHYLLVAAFHEQPTTGCCASFKSPFIAEVDKLAKRLPEPRAIDALFALGFRSVILHPEEYLKPANARVLAASFVATPPGGPHLVDIGTADGHSLYRLESATPVTRDLERLVAGAGIGTVQPIQPVRTPSGVVTLWFSNPGPATYRHPDPLAPTALRVRWYGQNETLVAEHRVTAMLPLALASGDVASREVEMPVPNATDMYRVAAAPTDAPESVVATARVMVGGAVTP